MDLVLQSKICAFASRMIEEGWEWCGAQESFPPVPPILIVISPKGVKKRFQYNPNPDEFDALELANSILNPKRKKMTLREKLHAIYTAIDMIEKRGENSKQGYAYIKAADVTREIRKHLIEQRVYAEINFDFAADPFTIARSKEPNAPFSAVAVKASVVFHDLDSLEVLTGSGLGTGADTGDKAAYKAQTGALKYALKNAFLVPDEADPEADPSVDEGGPGSRTDDPPDFQEARHEAPRPATASKTHKPAEHSVGVQEDLLPPPPPPVPAEKQNQGPAVAPDREPGDDSETELPTEAELTAYRSTFKKLGDDLADGGKLKSSKGLPVNRKLLIFLLSITKAPEAKDITRTAWIDFFSRVEKIRTSEAGLIGLAKLINKKNGVEDKKG